ncbi:MAG: glycosyltransferase family 1 protein [Puia sp.]|nr:glycosyltransferase family 1 protein [Puia sp.]
MDLTGKKVCLLFRKPGRFFSIERIFNYLEPLLQKEISTCRWAAEHAKFMPGGLIRNILAVKRCSGDIYHVTGDIHYIVLGLPRRRTLLTIHDCVFLYQATGLKRRILKWLLLDIPVRRSWLITTISEATKKDIIRSTGCPAKKIIVIPDPIDDSLYYSPGVFREQEPVILFIGSTENKNLRRVAEALKDIPCRLDIVGNIPAAVRELLSENRINYTQQSGLTDEEIACKYRQADIMLFPSTFEGFGLPIIEAQQTGRPVVTSDLSPMKEVAGKGACLVNPLDPASIRAGILEVIGNKGYREDLVQRGLENVRQYAPSVIAQQYLSVYRQLLTH